MYDVNKLPLDELKSNDLDENYDLVEVPAPYFVRDAMLYVSCETSVFVADYYREFYAESDGFHPKILEWAEKNNGHWEWENPGCIVFISN